ncbi:MAG: response regulator [Pseudomonadota bacterium]
MAKQTTILIIDDSETIREITIRIVEDLGFEAIAAATASEALEICKDKSPNLVLLDWDLPKLTALDFLKGAAALDENDRPEIVLCATENDHQQFTLAKAAGAAHHILKPFDKQAVAAKFKEIGLLKSKPAGQSSAVA